MARGQHTKAQRGAALPEALVAFLVLSLGMLALAKLQGQLRLNSDIARQRSEAVRLAQEDMEKLRAFSAIAPTAESPSYADIASATVSVGDGYRSNAGYRIERSVANHAAPAYKSASVTVNWADRTGAQQHVVLNSVISANHPALSGALTVPGTTDPVRGVLGRSARIPLAAKDLGNGSSVFKPVAAGTVAWVFSHASGQVTARCNVAANLQTRNLAVSDLTDCVAATAVLLSGQVRLSTAVPPDPTHANDTPLPLTVTVQLTGVRDAASPVCLSEAQKVVAIASPGGSRRETVPLAATPAAMGLAGWIDLGERFVAYHCAIAPLGARWSGLSTVIPQGWTIGSAANEYKVCRFSADQDESGAVDTNAEHPDRYVDVDGSLMQQNFLIIRADQSCPLGTVQHQP